jgi:hypothetical protein
LILGGCRYAVRLDAGAGRLLSLGVSLRLLAYAALFFISYLDLSFLRELHAGDGFWRVAPDAKLYYDLALGIPRPDGSTLASEAAPSPGFVRALSAWMWVVGPGPAAGALLNTFCYLAVGLLVMTLMGGERRAMRLLVAAFSFSPALIVFGSQPLKDTFVLSLVVALCAVAWFVTRHLAGPQRRAVMSLNGLVVVTGFVLLASIRAYYALFLVGALAATLPFSALAAPGGRLRVLGRAAAIVGMSAAAVFAGMDANGRETIRQFSGINFAWNPGRPSYPPIPTGVPLAAAPSIPQPGNADRQMGNSPRQAAGGVAGNVLTRDLAAASSVMSVKYNNLLRGDVLYVEATGQREYLYVGGFVIATARAVDDQLAFDLGGNACGGPYFNDGKAFYIPDGPHAGWWLQAAGGCRYSAPHTVITVTGDVTSQTASGYILYFADTSTAPASYQYAGIRRDYEDSGSSRDWKAGDAINRGAAGLFVPARVVRMLDRARRGLSTQGRTNFGDGTTPTGVWDRIGALGRGAAAVWIPVFLLRPLGVVDVGRWTGFLAIAELDTVFNGGMLLAVTIVLWRRRAQCQHCVWYLAFVGVIVALTGLGFAYVITNFGTLFRMRLMVMVPLWMTLLATASGQAASRGRSGASAAGR